MKRLIITLETSLLITDVETDCVTKNPCGVRLHIDADALWMSASIKLGATDHHLGYIDNGKIIKMAIDKI